MTATFILHGDVQRMNAKRAIDRAPAGYVVTFRERTRSSAQNDKMQAMLTDIARAKPGGRVMDKDLWKAAFMDEIGIKSDFIPSLTGDTVIAVGFRSSKLSVSRMAELLECIAAYGAEHGVRWSNEPDHTKELAA